MKPVRIAAVVLFFLTALSPLNAGEMRTWTDVTGTFSVEAELVETKWDRVVLRSENGKTVEVMFEKLSEADHEYLLALEDAKEKAAMQASSEAAVEEEVEKPKKEAPFLDRFWFELRAAARENARENKMARESMEDMRRYSSHIPEEYKHEAAFPGALCVALIFALPTYIWLLVHEVRANLLWGVAQVTADGVGCCFFPLMGTIVLILFAINNFSFSWKPILAVVAVNLTLVLGVMMIPSDFYSFLDQLPTEEEQEMEAY